MIENFLLVVAAIAILAAPIVVPDIWDWYHKKRKGKDDNV